MEGPESRLAEDMFGFVCLISHNKSGMGSKRYKFAVVPENTLETLLARVGWLAPIEKDK